MSSAISRGLFIVLEGIDRCGKSTQTVLLQAKLSSLGWKTCLLRFPDRTTRTGTLIDEVLKSHEKIDRRSLHLLFSANRWEKMDYIEDLLISGVTVICDRYAYSGIAYSVGAEKLDLTWCLNADRGLIRPDVIYQLVTDPLECSLRAEYGSERYESSDLARSVEKAYTCFHSNRNWHKIITSHEGDPTMQIGQTAKAIYDHLMNFVRTLPTAAGAYIMDFAFLGVEAPW